MNVGTWWLRIQRGRTAHAFLNGRMTRTACGMRGYYQRRNPDDGIGVRTWTTPDGRNQCSRCIAAIAKERLK